MLAIFLLTFSTAAAQQQGASYLGCFSFPRLLYLKGVEGVKPTQNSKANINTCFKDCRNKGYSLSIVSTDYKCWCAIATPPPLALVDESVCQPGSNKGALVFFLYEGADACRIQELDAKADSYQPAPGTSPGNAAFDSLSQNLDLQADAAHGVQRVVAKFQPQLYGQFEVAARVSVHPAVITAIDIQEAGTSNPQVSTTTTEDITWQFFNTSSSGIGKNMLLGTASRPKSSASVLETLLKPAQYKLPGGLKQDENIGTAWVTYTINWQKDRVTWAMNGVPLLTKWAGAQQQPQPPPPPPQQTVQGQAKVSESEGALLKPLMSQQGHMPHQTRRGLLSDGSGGSNNPQELQQKRLLQRKHSKSAAQQQQTRGVLGPQDSTNQQARWAPPNKPAQFSFGIWWNANPWNLGSGGDSGSSVAAAAVDAQQQPLQAGTHSNFMEVRRIVCNKPRVRGDKGPVVPTWFVLGDTWETQQQQQQVQQQQKLQQQHAKQQQQAKQQLKQQRAKVQADNPTSSSAKGAGGIKAPVAAVGSNRGGGPASPAPRQQQFVAGRTYAPPFATGKQQLGGVQQQARPDDGPQRDQQHSSKHHQHHQQQQQQPPAEEPTLAAFQQQQLNRRHQDTNPAVVPKAAQQPLQQQTPQASERVDAEEEADWHARDYQFGGPQRYRPPMEYEQEQELSDTYVATAVSADTESERPPATAASTREGPTEVEPTMGDGEGDVQAEGDEAERAEHEQELEAEAEEEWSRSRLFVQQQQQHDDSDADAEDVDAEVLLGSGGASRLAALMHTGVGAEVDSNASVMAQQERQQHSAAAAVAAAQGVGGEWSQGRIGSWGASEKQAAAGVLPFPQKVAHSSSSSRGAASGTGSSRTKWRYTYK